MVTGSEPRHGSPVHDPAVKEQLEKLFGKSLFGAWPELQASGPTSFVPNPRGSRSKRWVWRFALLLACALIVWGGYALFRPGLQRTADMQRANLAEELRVFVNDGNLERASEFVELVRGQFDPQRTGTEKRRTQDKQASKTLSAADPHLDLIVLTEATLYRYFDADAARLRQIQPFLESAGSSSPWRQLAFLTILSREERAAKLPDLERLREQLPNRSEPVYLLATAWESRGDAARARAAWARSEELGPAWLGHRFEQAWFEWHHAERGAAQKAATQIVRFEPESAWAKLASSTFRLEKAVIAQLEADRMSDAAAPRVTPVQTHFRALVESIDSAQRNEPARAREQLLAAMAAIHDEPPFLFDAFDWLAAEQLSSLALTLTEQSGWPSGSSTAASKLRRLSELVDRVTKVEVSTQAKPNEPSSAAKPKASKPKRRVTKKQ